MKLYTSCTELGIHKRIDIDTRIGRNTYPYIDIFPISTTSYPTPLHNPSTIEYLNYQIPSITPHLLSTQLPPASD
ncbi:unnamed protein product [Penicillium roqueforti FM164]|uniref:Genomic scaffold, ProqFM164S02 n=1 Tax=Penicillium roqueforti (strain FM164) TaxID=1365484 RepID=W6QQS5_PENRF|nr:unnamed protein product [Penicillium roqueforti FM164]